jgi:hypothetical protein
MKKIWICKYVQEFGTLLLFGCTLFAFIGVWCGITFGPIVGVCILADAYNIHTLIAMPMIVLAYFIVFVFLRHFKFVDDLEL